MIASLIPRVNAVSESQKEFYISYCWKTADYGTDTTDMFIHETSQFLILSGDHRENYKGLDFKQSLAYFYANVDKAVP